MAIRTASGSRAGWLPSMAPVKGLCIVTLEAGKRRIKHLPARDDDDVQSGGDLMTPKDFPRESLGPIPLDSGPELSAGGDSQS